MYQNLKEMLILTFLLETLHLNLAVNGTDCAAKVATETR